MTMKTRTFLVATLLAVVALRLTGCGAIQGLEPSKTTAHKFLKLMQAGETETAYKLFSTECKAVTTQEQLQNYWELVEKNRGKVKDWSLEGTHFSSGTGGSKVTLTYKLHCEKGESAARFGLVPEKGRWLIQGFNFSG
jgi:hypothetical protein